MYKNQLQELAQRSCFSLPSYVCTREGPDHAPRFRAAVTFNGETFEGPSGCTTLRQAEHAAAEVALARLSLRGPSTTLAARVLVSHRPSSSRALLLAGAELDVEVKPCPLCQDETGVYKNLLQETAHRAGLKLPAYTTVRSGPGHSPVFSSTVELAGLSFAGDPARTKKQAEKNAAMAAWSSLKQSTSSAQSRKHKPCAYLYASRGIINGPRHGLCSAGGSQGARRRRRAGARGCRQSARGAEAARRRRRKGGAASAEAQQQRLFFLRSSEPVAVQTPMAASDQYPCPTPAAEDGGPAPAAAGRPKDPAPAASATTAGVRLQGRRGGRAGADVGARHGARPGGNAAFAVLLRGACRLGVPPRQRAEDLRRGRVPRPGCERAVGDPGVRRPAAADPGQGGKEWPGDTLRRMQEGVSDVVSL